jgi:processive 1,2-diacylglycerol beta-glucosyltransferase
MARRILILTASIGAGHVRAAEAVEVALRERDSSATVERHDVMALTNAVFRRMYGKAYIDLVNHAPHMVGMIYDWSDKPQATRGVKHKLRHLVQQRNLSRVVAKIGEGWDLVVHTHFLAPDLMASMARKKSGKWGVVPRMVTVVTDFEAHGFWLNEPCEHYFTATEEARLALMAWGVPTGSITVTGIPIHPVFSRGMTREEARGRHGLDLERPVVLLLGGGFGLGPMERIYAELLRVDTPMQVVAVCGRNEALKERLGKVAVPGRHAAKVLGFTTVMHEWLSAADLAVTKPGGLTVSECMARGVGMVIMNPIPGQESRNSDWLLERGVAVKVNSIATLAWKVGGLLADAGWRGRLRGAAGRWAKPRAAYDVADAVLNMTAGSAAG